MRNIVHLAAATSEQIEEAEQELGLHFYTDYREYVSELGVASFYGHEFTGICASPRLNVVDVTNSNKTVFTDIPSDWYVLEEANIDDIVIWQSSTGEVYQTAPNVLPVKLSDSFLEYLELLDNRAV